MNWYYYYRSSVEREWLQMNWYHYYRSSVEREWLQMNWYHYYGSSVEREWLRMNMNVFSVQRMRGCVILRRKIQFPTWGNSKQITSSHVMNQSEAIFGKETGKLKNS